MGQNGCWRWGGKDYGWFVGIPGVLIVEHWCRDEKPDPALWGHGEGDLPMGVSAMTGHDERDPEARGSYATGGPIDADAAARMAAQIEANSP